MHFTGKANLPDTTALAPKMASPQRLRSFQNR
ncbi:hypothetical protein CXB40_15340 [Pseudomonas syringae pv. avii]|uniref:Uncharacterized protein n=1 Tax=Pseudomonas syringae pv. tomato (strain ATCC BAA-871 / DC3000) TaxID=223283 RepID=Q885G2_PSESM|nr:hypothetical protein PSPTO_1872 [Pseudomonas syringae pv. tomato str. DC3000]MBW8023774.1 hypothetical protein [Pseudomonas syringae pv. tomato]MCF5226702.1 hypothetical protein [Pseudomonas syringae]POQ07381.1 hypothetical protein CXB40_15340 [Pseudomonas syringae pv. avii]PYD03710.1 hypothetical protein DND90_03220 [Pseudomonas syringae pv. maculicola]